MLESTTFLHVTFTNVCLSSIFEHSQIVQTQIIRHRHGVCSVYMSTNSKYSVKENIKKTRKNTRPIVENVHSAKS